MAPEECPPFDPLGPNQAGIGQYLQVLGCSRGADSKLLPDVVSTDPVFDQIAIDLRWKITPRILEQIKDCQARAAGQSLEHGN
jgi:hypothetical protein